MGPRIVLDTNVLLSAFGWRGTPYEILCRALDGYFCLLISPALLDELQRVLSYPKFHYPEAKVARFLVTIAEGAEMIFAPCQLSVVAKDPADDRILECALAGAADFIKFGIKQAGGILRASQMLATAQAAGLPCVIGHGFGLDPSTTAEVMLAATSRNVVAGLECVGPLKVKDTVATTRLDISSGSLRLPEEPGLGISLDEAKLEQYPLK